MIGDDQAGDASDAAPCPMQSAHCDLRQPGTGSRLCQAQPSQSGTTVRCSGSALEKNSSVPT